MGFNLDLGKYSNQLEKQIKKGINQSLRNLEPDIERFSPVDTGEYIDGNLKTEAIQIGNQIKGSVFNESENAVQVEYGFRTTNSNWSKKGGSPIVEQGVGARVYTKAFDKNEQDIKRIINKNIDLG